MARAVGAGGSAGALRESMTFECRLPDDDGAGNTEGEFVAQFTMPARLTPRLGGEVVMAARLAGKTPVVIKVRCCNDTARITTDWRVRDARNMAVVYNILSIVNVDEQRKYFDLLCEQGGAT